MGKIKVKVPVFQDTTLVKFGTEARRIKTVVNCCGSQNLIQQSIPTRSVFGASPQEVWGASPQEVWGI